MSSVSIIENKPSVVVVERVNDVIVSNSNKNISITDTNKEIIVNSKTSSEYRNIIVEKEVNRTTVIQDKNPVITIAVGKQGNPGSAGGSGEEVLLRTFNNNVEWKYTNDVVWTFLYTIPSGEEEMNYAKKVDFVGDFIYKGEAVIGSTTDLAVWRISKTYIHPSDGDIDITWADANADFDNIWDNHLTLTYS